MATLPRRSDLSEDQRWNIESVFSDAGEWTAEREQLAPRFKELQGFRGNLGESASALLDALRLRDEIGRRVEVLISYAMLRRSEDSANQTYSALADQAMSLWAQAGASWSFMEPEILSIDPGTIEEFVQVEPDLATFRHYFETLNLRREHIRSEEVEELLARATEISGGYQSVSNVLENVDLDLGVITDANGNEAELGQGNLGAYLQSPDRDVRRRAWTSAADAYVSLKNTFAAAYSGSVKSDVFYATARNYDSSLDAALGPQAIPTSVFHNLLDTVWRNLPTWHRYFRIRRRVLGVDELHEWDITAPLVRESRHIPWQQATTMVVDSLAPLGEEYAETVQRGLAERWVDPYPNRGKHGGAFSGGAPGTMPFISMNYTDDFNSVSTLAHELGHSMHSYYTWNTQPHVYTDYGMIVAETASNMHQALMGKKLLDEIEDPQFLIEVIEERMSNHLRYFFTMPILARFEHECHQIVEGGGALTATGMTERLADLYEEAYGGEVVVDRERMGVTWARFPHLYMAYYVYSYAIGIAAAAELSNQVLAEGEPAAERYIGFLRTGASKFEIDALRDAGVDMTEPGPVQAAFDVLASYVDRLDELTR